MAADTDALSEARKVAEAIQGECRRHVQGRDDVITLVVTGLLADGHVLLEDHPGSGKTTLAKALGGCLAQDSQHGLILPVRRIQFTPDLLPSDITGTTVFDGATKSLTFRPGPLFANVVLADEINRTSPKVQAALLEAMAEKQITVDERTHPLHELFFVIATQNPLDLAGTYPLPRAQLDRFLFKIRMVPLAAEHQLEVLAAKEKTVPACTLALTPDAIATHRTAIRKQVHVDRSIHKLLVELAESFHGDRRVVQGTSTRSLVQAIPALQTWAMLAGRDFVNPGDVKDLSLRLFAHRLMMVPGVKDPEAVVAECAAPVLESAIRRTLSTRTIEAGAHA